MSQFVGRNDALAALAAAYAAVTPGRDGVRRRAGLVLVTGEAGMGKTTLLSRFATRVARRGGTVVWGTCWDGGQAPALWPWTQALLALLDDRAELRAAVAPELAAVVPDVATRLGPGGEVTAAGQPQVTDDSAGRLQVFDAASRLLSRAAADAPLVVILDDLHWADRSTLDLLRFAIGQTYLGPLLLAGAYRPDEMDTDIASALAALTASADMVALRGLAADEVAELVQAVAGAPASSRWAREVQERSGGHPFFARELCRLLAAGGESTAVPAAVREVIARRLGRLSDRCVVLLEVAAVAGAEVLLDVLGDVTGQDSSGVAGLVAEAAGAGILSANDGGEGPGRFTHDLYRESIYTGLPAHRRLDLHHRIGAALVRRHERGSLVFSADLARHFAAAVPVAGAESALAWASVAAEADVARFAFAEAAGHLARARSAVEQAGDRLDDADLVGILTAEADLRFRGGDAARARALLDTAWGRATATSEPDLVATVALGLDRVGARFAMPRAHLVTVLNTARTSLAGAGTPAEARVTAALARQLQHSVPADRPRARPLAEQAVAVARGLDDPATLASCLLAHHDTLWTPGTATQREAIAGEIADLAQRADDPERHAQALLLTATAQLESGSPAFRVTLAEWAYITERLRQPRHDYMLRTRQAALALLDGDIATGERLSAEAAALGEAAGDSDTGNVRMSQRLEMVRVRNDATELRGMAANAVRWWIGAPAHAHAVAAGFCARAGDLDAARQEVDTVLALNDWRTDRSYLWSVFIGELAAAAIALDDRLLCQHLLDDLLPVADTCAVNGALVCFMGAHAHRVGLLHAALRQAVPARHWLLSALATHRRLGARAWEAETLSALAALGDEDARQYAHRARQLRDACGLEVATAGAPAATPPGALAGTPAIADQAAHLRRVGDMWEAAFRGRTAYLRDAKGLHDLAALLARPGTDLPALELAGALVSDTTGQDGMVDRAALSAYRRRLAELDRELAVADDTSDLARHRRAVDEREELLAEVRRSTRPGGAIRAIAPTAAERARKAVTARIRDAIRRIRESLPELGAHLDRTIRTGTICRYDKYP